MIELFPKWKQLINGIFQNGNNQWYVPKWNIPPK
jgi:hypothetical protein